MSAQSVAETRCSPGRHGGEASASAPLHEISNAMVRLYREAFGRGPTKVRTTFAGTETVVVVLEDAFTAAERSLLALGEVERLRKSRLLQQQALEAPARSIVEGALRRRSAGFITGVDARYGIAVNVFTLEPVAVTNGHGDGTDVVARSAR